MLQRFTFQNASKNKAASTCLPRRKSGTLGGIRYQPDVRSDLERAQDCLSPSDWLAMAAYSSDPNILKAVARNPNTPKNELFRLWGMFPQTAMENPIITLWEFSSQGSVGSEIPKNVLFSLYQEFLKRPDLPIPDVIIPIEWRIYFLKSQDVKPKLALHYFVRDPSEKVRLALLENALPTRFEKFGSAKFPLESAEELLREATPAIKKAFACAVAKKWIVLPNQDICFLERTARQLYSLDGVIEYLSCWESLPPDLIDVISQVGSLSILVNLASLPRCPQCVYERLARSEFPEVRAAVARFTPSVELHEQLFHDPNVQVRAGLAASHHIADEMQRRLVLPKNADIHLALLKNPRVIPEVLGILGSLPNTGIKNQLLIHPSLPQDTFDELLANSKKYNIAQERIAGRPEFLTPELYRRHKNNLELCVLLAYANLPHTPSDILAELACHTNGKIHATISDLLSHRPHRASAISDRDAMAIIETVLNHPDTTGEHSILRSPRMSSNQAIRIFENPRFDAELRFSVVLDRLKLCRKQGLFAEYADIYRKIVVPLEFMLPDLSLNALCALSTQDETPTKIREILKNHPDNNLRASNMAQSRTIPFGAIIDAFPEAFPPNGTPIMHATPHQILKKLAASPHLLLAAYAERCLHRPPKKWAKLVGAYSVA
jgi:hypothetical protein